MSTNYWILIRICFPGNPHSRSLLATTHDSEYQPGGSCSRRVPPQQDTEPSGPGGDNSIHNPGRHFSLQGLPYCYALWPPVRPWLHCGATYIQFTAGSKQKSRRYRNNRCWLDGRSRITSWTSSVMTVFKKMTTQYDCVESLFGRKYLFLYLMAICSTICWCSRETFAWKSLLILPSASGKMHQRLYLISFVSIT